MGRGWGGHRPPAHADVSHRADSVAISQVCQTDRCTSTPAPTSMMFLLLTAGWLGARLGRNALLRFHRRRHQHRRHRRVPRSAALSVRVIRTAGPKTLFISVGTCRWPTALQSVHSIPRAIALTIWRVPAAALTMPAKPTATQRAGCTQVPPMLRTAEKATLHTFAIRPGYPRISRH